MDNNKQEPGDSDFSVTHVVGLQWTFHNLFPFLTLFNPGVSQVTAPHALAFAGAPIDRNTPEVEKSPLAFAEEQSRWQRPPNVSE